MIEKSFFTEHMGAFVFICYSFIALSCVAFTLYSQYKRSTLQRKIATQTHTKNAPKESASL